MRKRFVLTLAGPDRVGIVDDVTRLLLARGGNVETSRMTRLGGEFAMLLLVSLPAERAENWGGDWERLSAQGYHVSIVPSDRPADGPSTGWRPYLIKVEAADHEGIIQEVAHYLSERGISIESMDSDTAPAPLSGAPLFTMTARALVPPRLAGSDWEAGLEELARGNNLELRLSQEAQPAASGL